MQQTDILVSNPYAIVVFYCLLPALSSGSVFQCINVGVVLLAVHLLILTASIDKMKQGSLLQDYTSNLLLYLSENVGIVLTLTAVD